MKGVVLSECVPHPRCMSILLFLVIYFSCACQGGNLDSRNINSLPGSLVLHKLRLESGAKSTVIGTDTIRPFEMSESYRVVGSFHLIVETISVVVSNSFLLIILDFLHNLALAKECLLLFLYKDLMKLGICLNSFEMLCYVVSYSTENWTAIQISGAKIMSLMTISIFHMLLLIMNAVSALHLYMNRKNMLDPPMPWGEDDFGGIKYIRGTCTTLTITFTLTMYGLGIYPKLYYWTIGEDPDKEPESVIIYTVVLILLIFTSAVTSLGTKFYKSSSLPLVDTVIPQKINYIYTILFLSLTFSLFLRLFDVLDSSDMWTVWQFNVDIVQVATPIIIILRTNQLKDYTYHFIKPKFEDLFFFQIYLTPVLICLFMYSTLHVIYNQFKI